MSSSGFNTCRLMIIELELRVSMFYLAIGMNKAKLWSVL